MIGRVGTVYKPVVQPSLYSQLISYAALYTILVLAFAAWLEYDQYADNLKSKVIVETMFVGSTFFLLLAFFGNVYATQLVLDRYFGVVSYIMLPMLAGLGASFFLKRRLGGKCFVLCIVILLLIGFTFGGSFTPDYTPFSSFRVCINVESNIRRTRNSAEFIAHILGKTCSRGLETRTTIRVFYAYFKFNGSRVKVFYKEHFGLLKAAIDGNLKFLFCITPLVLFFCYYRLRENGFITMIRDTCGALREIVNKSVLARNNISH